MPSTPASAFVESDLTCVKSLQILIRSQIGPIMLRNLDPNAHAHCTLVHPRLNFLSGSLSFMPRRYCPEIGIVHPIPVEGSNSHPCKGAFCPSDNWESAQQYEARAQRKYHFAMQPTPRKFKVYTQL